MNDKKEFFVPYIKGSLGKRTRKNTRLFVVILILIVLCGALVFGFSQNKFKNSTFELTSETTISGIYNENPYPMLRVKLSANEYKNILLIGFGKSDASPFLEKLMAEHSHLIGKEISISGNLIYYNGKTLLQITNEDNIVLIDKKIRELPAPESIGMHMLTGEIVDPKCYFGVMKPGKGKIHKSCAILCISGGIPPVFVSSNEDATVKYFLVTDINRNAIQEDVLEHIGEPIEVAGEVEKFGDWYILKIDPTSIKNLGRDSTIYSP